MYQFIIKTHPQFLGNKLQQKLTERQ